MPKKLHELISQAIHAEYCYKKAKINKALENPNSPEFDLLYQMVGAELARINPPLILPYVEVCISPQCTLRCRDCANFMQHYDKPKPMDLAAVKSWIDALLESVDHILTFRVMGGEPLMQKQLPELMRYLIAQGKLQHIQIVTNGTLKPREEHVDGKIWCEIVVAAPNSAKLKIWSIKITDKNHLLAQLKFSRLHARGAGAADARQHQDLVLLLQLRPEAGAALPRVRPILPR